MSMSHAICKLEDFYFVWSTVVDAPITSAMTLLELLEHTERLDGRHGLMDIGERLMRVERTGTSFRMDESVSETVGHNRAGPNESQLTEAELIEHLRD